MLHHRQTKRDTTVAGKWYKELGSLLQQLGTTPQIYFSDADLRCLSICVSDLDLEDDHSISDAASASNQASPFFKPLPEESARITSCAAAHITLLKTEQRTKEGKNTEPYSLSGDLKAAISLHKAAAEIVYPSGWRYLNFRTEYKEMSKWTRNHSDNKPFHLFGATTTATALQRETKTPHLILRLLSNYPADERLARSELIVLTNFIRSGIRTQVLRHRQASRSGNAGWSGLNVKVPILLISILNPARARIVQACFDGILKLQRSRLYSFDGPCKPAEMGLFIRWMKGRPCGKTCLGASLGVVPECEERCISRLGWKA